MNEMGWNPLFSVFLFILLGNCSSHKSELITRSAERPGLKLDHRFRGHFLASKTSGVGLDLASIVLKQERDHGLAGYNRMRANCGMEKVRQILEEIKIHFLNKISTFAELRPLLANESLSDRLATIYETVDDIDLLVGVLAERPRKGAFVGPTLACIMGKQFQRVYFIPFPQFHSAYS